MRSLIFVCLLISTGLAAQQAEPIIFLEKIHDFGEIAENGGNADFEYTFTNNSGRPIKILTVQASCGCTTPGWTKESIAQGKTGFVKASFDPKGRPGYFNKSLTVTTDFDSNPIVLQIKGTVKNSSTELTVGSFPASNGNLRLKQKSFNLARVYNNREAQTKEFTIYNAGEKIIHFEKAIAPAYLKVKLPEFINPGAEQVIGITYDAKLRNQFGFVTDNIEILTDDEDLPRKSFSVYVTLEEYFAPLSTEESKLAPVLRLDEYMVDMGRVRQGNKLQQELIIKNVGKKDLLIRSVQPNCKCITAVINQTKISAGGEAKLTVLFSTDGRTGTQQKALTIYSSDPKNPVQRITLSAYIEN